MLTPRLLLLLVHTSFPPLAGYRSYVAVREADNVADEPTAAAAALADAEAHCTTRLGAWQIATCRQGEEGIEGTGGKACSCGTVVGRRVRRVRVRMLKLESETCLTADNLQLLRSHDREGNQQTAKAVYPPSRLHFRKACHFGGCWESTVKISSPAAIVGVEPCPDAADLVAAGFECAKA